MDPSPSDGGSAAPPTRTGSVIAGYRLLDLIGRGGMGEVYRVRRDGDTRDRALKVLAPDVDTNPDQAESRFRREAVNHGKVDHPNVVRVLDAGAWEGTLFLVMELVDGSDLAALIEKSEPIPVVTVARMALQIVEAMDHLHGIGLVHRDLKPSNILLTRSGEPKITDFGLARGVDQTILTQPNSVLGTLYYLAPEQAMGEQAGPASDFYALGLILYELITAHFPYTGTDVRDWLTKITTSTPMPASAWIRDLPPAIDGLLAALLAKQPDRRPKAAAVRAVLQSILEPTPAVPKTLVKEKPGPVEVCKRVPPILTDGPFLHIAIGGAVLAALIGTWSMGPQAKAARPVAVVPSQAPPPAMTLGNPRTSGMGANRTQRPRAVTPGPEFKVTVGPEGLVSTHKAEGSGGPRDNARAGDERSIGPDEPDVLLESLVEKATRGDPEAQHAVGLRYEFGEGVPVDLDQARKWYEKAHSQGHLDAKVRLDLLMEQQ